MGKQIATAGFIASSSISLTGNSVAAVALPLAQLAITGDALAAGIVAIACVVPQVLAGIFGGALLDRFNRRSISIISDVISALSIAALPIIHMTVGLSLEWFILFGILGAIGDIPGMTARDTLFSAVLEHDGRDLQSYMGIYGAIQSLAVIIGPAIAALAMGALGIIGTLWITAGMSLMAAGVSLAIPHEVGQPPTATPNSNLAENTPANPEASSSGPFHATIESTKEGLRILFASSPVLRFSVAATLAVVMVLGALQGIVLPVFFTEQGTSDLLGYTLSALSFGSLAGSLIYAQFTHHLSQRVWYVLSLVGMVAGMAVICALPSYAFMLVGSAALGLFSGPVSALLGYLAYEIIPDERRGAALGAQNSILLVASPIAVFATSAIIAVCGVNIASAILCAIWIVLTAFALAAKTMRNLDGGQQSRNQAEIIE